MAFNDVGDLYIANAGAGKVVKLTPNSTTPPTATDFTAGGSVPGANGIAFHRDGNLYVSDGTTGEGRVWRIAPCALPPCAVTEVFRIQPMANVLNPVTTGGISNVGRDVRTLPLGTIGATRLATNTLDSQPLVANGLAFNREGDLFVSDTARGAIWKAEFDRHGNLESQTGCDSTFTANTLCLENVFVAHPVLEGADGIALDRAGNIWTIANERNAVAVVTRDGRVAEVFRNPVNSIGLRNSADTAAGNTHILEFPASPFISEKTLCVSSFERNRRDNSPSSAGETDPAGTFKGKISCMDQELIIQGLPLPIQ
jgi:sugar lactone lactonase YvrE